MLYLTLVPATDLVPPHLRRQTSYVFNTPTFRHRAVMELFGNLPHSPRKAANILFRLENIAGKPLNFLIQSAVEPEQTLLPSSAAVKSFTVPQFETGTVLAFRLAVNGVQRSSNGGVKPLPLWGKTEEKDAVVEEWLARKLTPAFSEIHLVNHIRELISDDQEHGGKTIQIDTFDGIARVEDSAALANLIENGVGRAKSYGCGLLTVKRA